MRGRILALVFLLTAGLLAAGGLSYSQLRQLLRSSIEQGLRDKEVAKYLKDQSLGFALTDRMIEEFVGWGVGPKTASVLRDLKPATQGLTKPDVEKYREPRRRQPPPPSEEEQERIIDEARQSALDYTKRLPDFICLQITQRYVDPAGLELNWLKQDTIKTRVSYVDNHENYEVISVNNRATNSSLRELGGATSTGEFGTMLAELFDPETEAQFRWARHSLLRGRGVYVFHFQVPKSRSRWRLSFERRREIITAYRGLVYIDKETERVLRIVMAAEGVPPDFPIREARTRLDYDFTQIAGRRYLLPLKAEVRMRQDKLLARNEVQFRLYRKFSADATISFSEAENVEPLPDDEGEPEDF